jgi:hypothetical protein
MFGTIRMNVSMMDAHWYSSILIDWLMLSKRLAIDEHSRLSSLRQHQPGNIVDCPVQLWTVFVIPGDEAN